MTHKNKILVVEDDLSLQRELKDMLNQLEYDIVDVANDSHQVLKTISVKKPDIILMDIDIKCTISGIELGKLLQPLNIPIIYITSDNNRTLYQKAKEDSNVVSYMVKPINPVELEATLDFILNNSFVSKDEISNNTDQSLLFKKKSKYFKVYFNEILYVIADGAYSLVYTKDNHFISTKKIKDLEALLPKPCFYRSHRGCIVNLKHLICIDTDDNSIVMNDDKVLPLSRNNKSNLLDILNSKYC